MFQLIVAVISIVLVAALAIASIYYGGEAFNKSSLRANVTTLVNGGQQIAGAQALYRTDMAVSALDIDSLLTATNGEQYLAAIPGTSKLVANGDVWSLNATGSVASVELAGAATEACTEVGRQSNSTATFADEAAFLAGTAQFACVGDATAKVFSFKL